MSTLIETPITIPTSINSLPIEIKAQIVKLASLQDENYIIRINNDYRDSESDESEEEEEKVSNVRRWKGKSLNALFLVDKEWSNLAAVHLFRTLSARQELDSLTFELSILFHRNHFIKSVKFFYTDHPEKLLRALSNLPNVYELALSASVSRKLFGNLKTLGNSGQAKFDQQFSTFRTVGARITKVYLYGFDSIEATQILSVFPNLKKLTLDTTVFEVAGLLDLGNVLATYSFQSLYLSNLSKEVLLSWKDLKLNSSSSLDNLTLKSRTSSNVNDLEISLDFSSIFSTSLESFTIQTLFATAVPLIKPFFHLQHLNVDTDCASIPFIINSFPKSPIISLFIESLLDDFAENATHLETAFISFVNQHQTLRYLEFKDKFNRYDHFPNLIQLCMEKKIQLVFSPYSTPSSVDILSDEIDSRKPSLKEAFQFGQMRLLELERENDIEGMKEMYDNCKWLRASAAERKD